MTRPSATVGYDFPEVLVGSVEYDDGPTGCTLVCFEAGASCAVDVRGGAVAAREMMTVAASDSWGEVDGILFTGGSTWGLDAAAGVVHRLSEERGGAAGFDDIPAVPTAAVYDFLGRDNTVHPDAELGVAAYDALKTGVVDVGRKGAGANVTVGTYLSDAHASRAGQGACFTEQGGLKVLALAVVNACGNVYDRTGRRMAGGPDAHDTLVAKLQSGQEAAARRKGGHTLLLAVITNAALDRLELSRVAVMGNAGAARLIEPFHTPDDGDVCFALSTNGRRLPRGFTAGDVGVLAARCVQDAILNAIESASVTRQS